MTDREKVIKGLQIERECVSRDCDRNCGQCDLVQDREWLLSVYDEALALLKEQEAKWIEYPECLAYDGAYSDSHIVCSACKHVFDIMDNCTEEFDYCPHCGAKMK